MVSLGTNTDDEWEEKLERGFADCLIRDVILSSRSFSSDQIHLPPFLSSSFFLLFLLLHHLLHLDDLLFHLTLEQMVISTHYHHQDHHSDLSLCVPYLVRSSSSSLPWILENEWRKEVLKRWAAVGLEPFVFSTSLPFSFGLFLRHVSPMPWNSRQAVESENCPKLRFIIWLTQVFRLRERRGIIIFPSFFIFLFPLFSSSSSLFLLRLLGLFCCVIFSPFFTIFRAKCAALTGFYY